MKKFLQKLKGRFAYEFVITFTLLSVILVMGTILYRMYFLEDKPQQSFDEYVPAETKSASNEASPTPEQNNEYLKPIPDKMLIRMPFTTQAPDANWDALHEESCEEASLIMLRHYKENSTIDSTSQAETEIQDLVAYETANGYKMDVTTTELSQIAAKKYGMTSGRVKTGAIVDDIKREIASGRPVIVPAAGKLLDNPNFKGGGPLYHMLVIKGYDKDGFITNDPGTRKGEDFRYTYANLFGAIHDWNASDIMQGGKDYLVFD